jgi:DNA polymerase-3 subunit delta
MALKQRCFFIYGADAYQSERALAAIKQRFQQKADSMADLITYDMEATSLDQLKQTMMTTPFFVTHRLFILRHPFHASKATQEALPTLFEKTAASTVIVCFETAAPDQRVSLFKWLKNNATLQEHAAPTAAGLVVFAAQMARKEGVTLDRSAEAHIMQMTDLTPLALSHEIPKLACYALSQGRTTITAADIMQLCAFSSELSVFQLTDSLKAGNIKQTLLTTKKLLETEDPLMLAGMLGNYVRTLAKIFLAKEQGEYNQAGIAKATGLNPYVVKLSMRQADSLTPKAIKGSYAQLRWFDDGAKTSAFTPELGLLLLILRLHGNLTIGTK